MSDKPHASSNGTTIGFRVEARTDGKFQPERIGEQTFDGEWRTVEFARGVPGVPGDNSLLAPFNLHYALMPYAQAQALRWWLLAGLGHRAFLVETRLRRYRVEYKSECHQEGESDLIVDSTKLPEADR